MQKVYVYTDGGSRGNPGPGAIAVVILDAEKNIIAEHKEFIGETTNNKAEYKAMVKAFEMAVKLKASELVCFSDSQLLVNQLKGEWKVRDDTLKPMFKSIKEMEKSFQKVTFNHIRRCSDRFSKLADELVNESLDSHKTCV
jgi:ribonuclease HI